MDEETAVINAKQNISTIKGMQPIMLQSEPAFTNFNLCFWMDYKLREKVHGKY